MSRATRFKLYRVLLIVAIVLVVPVIFVVGITLPYLFNTIKMTGTIKTIATMSNARYNLNLVALDIYTCI